MLHLPRFHIDNHQVKPWFVEGGDHNDIETTHEKEYFQKLANVMNSFIDLAKHDNRHGNRGQKDSKEMKVITTQPEAS